MPNFWSYIKNEKYAVGCTGQTVYVYDDSGKELARFKDIIYAYTPMFCPGQNMFVVKSTDGRLAVYSLDTMRLIKKFRFSKVDGSQDDGFCFSKDGKYFYNIERHIFSYKSCLSVYETPDFNRINQLFLEDEIELSHIEYDDIHDGLFLLGFARGKDGIYDYGFAAVFDGDGLTNITRIADEKYKYIEGYKSLEIKGFTAKAKECSSLFYNGCDLEKLEHIRLSDFVWGEDYEQS